MVPGCSLALDPKFCRKRAIYTNAVSKGPISLGSLGTVLAGHHPLHLAMQDLHSYLLTQCSSFWHCHGGCIHRVPPCNSMYLQNPNVSLDNTTSRHHPACTRELWERPCLPGAWYIQPFGMLSVYGTDNSMSVQEQVKKLLWIPPASHQELWACQMPRLCWAALPWHCQPRFTEQQAQNPGNLAMGWSQHP